MTVLNLATKTMETVGLLILSPLTIPIVRDISKPAVKAVIRAGFVACYEGKKLFDEARAELKEGGPTLLRIGERITEEVAVDLTEEIAEKELEGAAESTVAEVVEEAAITLAESLI